MQCERARELLGLERDGLLTDRERPELEAHLADCEDCRQHRELLKLFSGMDDETEAVSAPSKLCANVMAGLSSQPAPKKRKLRPIYYLPAIGTAAAVILLAVTFPALRGSLRNGSARLSASTTAIYREEAAAVEEAAEEEAAIAEEVGNTCAEEPQSLFVFDSAADSAPGSGTLLTVVSRGDAADTDGAAEKTREAAGVLVLRLQGQLPPELTAFTVTTDADGTRSIYPVDSETLAILLARYGDTESGSADLAPAPGTVGLILLEQADPD